MEMLIYILIIIGLKKNYFKSGCDLLLSKGILRVNIPKDEINKKKSENSVTYSSINKRTETSLSPYESVGK